MKNNLLKQSQQKLDAKLRNALEMYFDKCAQVNNLEKEIQEIKKIYASNQNTVSLYTTVCMKNYFKVLRRYLDDSS